VLPHLLGSIRRERGLTSAVWVEHFLQTGEPTHHPDNAPRYQIPLSEGTLLLVNVPFLARRQRQPRVGPDRDWQDIERYLGVEQDLTDAPCDHLGIRTLPARYSSTRVRVTSNG